MNDFKQQEFLHFTTDYVGDGVRYRLPRRKLPKARHLGWIVVAAGAFMTLFMVSWMWMPVSSGLEELQKGQLGSGLFTIAFGCFGLIGLIPGLGLLFGGLAIVTNCSRCDIYVRNGKITVKDRFFFARLKRRRPIADIRSLKISMASKSLTSAQEHQAEIWLGDYATGLVAKTKGKDLPIAIMYPKEMLTRLAEDIAPRLDAEINFETVSLPDNELDSDEPVTARRNIVVEEDDDAPEFYIPEQPAGSLATIDRRPYGITIAIPPAGVWRGSHGLMFFAVIWNTFIAIFLVMLTLAATGTIEAEDGSAPDVFMFLFMVPFVAVGIGITIASINMGRRRATIATADDLVMVVRESIFGKTTQEWSVQDLQDIRCGNSGMEMNDVPVKELQIIPLKGKKFGCLSQLDDDELVWIAAELKQSLGLTDADATERQASTLVERDSSGVATPPTGSRIKTNRAIDGISIDVPAVGLWKYLGLIAFGSVFAAIGVGVGVGVASPTIKRGFERLDVGELLFGAVFVIAFGGVGFATILAGLIAGRRRFHLEKEHDMLTLVRRGPFLSKTFRWHQDDLESVDVITSGTEVNNKKLYQVFIRSRKGESVGIMTGHDMEDLAFVAASINESLGLATTDVASV